MSDPRAQNAVPLVAVQLLALPVALWGRAQEHGDELVREFILIAGNRERRPGHEVPVALTELIEQLTASYGGFTAEQEIVLADAALAGVAQVDLTFHVPAHTADAVVELNAILDAADEYCRAGEHLLTLATPPEAVAFRRWYLGEFTRQIKGEPPLPWPEWLARNPD
ncbi:MAG TPA: hypothetical protein VGN54_13895 [Mycobacteriales bacterium]|nr:hypothetical protein [Mycobacteriales bacterium]